MYKTSVRLYSANVALGLGQGCLRRSGQLVGVRCAVSKQGCVNLSKESMSEKARGKDEKKEDGDDDVDTLETALRLFRSSKQGLKRKRSTSSSSQAQPGFIRNRPTSQERLFVVALISPILLVLVIHLLFIAAHTAPWNVLIPERHL